MVAAMVEESITTIIREACAIAYRRREGRLEFGLLRIEGDSRWEFPFSPIRAGEEIVHAALRVARELAGFDCRAADNEPLGDFSFVRDGITHFVTALLVEVKGDHPEWPLMQTRRRAWFLPEETRARLRRKPMRLLASVAQRRLVGAEGE
jgi:hypothetical protein